MKVHIELRHIRDRSYCANRIIDWEDFPKCGSIIYGCCSWVRVVAWERVIPKVGDMEKFKIYVEESDFKPENLQSI